MPYEWWTSYVLTILVLCIAPGNGAVLSMRYGLRNGVSYASPAVLGLQIGLSITYSVAVISLVLSSRLSERLLDVIAVGGGIYLIYLGIMDIWRAGFRGHDASTLNAQLVGDDDSFLYEPWNKRVMAGTITNVTNPKSILFMVAFMPQWLRVQAPWSLTHQAIVLGVVMLIIDASVMHGYAYLASMLKRLFARPMAFRLFEIALGGILCVLGASMVCLRFVS